MESQLSSAKDELDRARRDFTLERELLNDRLLQAAKDLEEARSKVSRKDGECIQGTPSPRLSSIPPKTRFRP